MTKEEIQLFRLENNNQFLMLNMFTAPPVFKSRKVCWVGEVVNNIVLSGAKLDEGEQSTLHFVVIHIHSCNSQVRIWM